MLDFLLDYGSVGMIVILLIGFGLLIGAWIILVRNSTRLGIACGLPATTVAITFPAIFAVAPEATIAVAAASYNHPELAVGQILGGAICNTCLIFGVTSLITPLRVTGAVNHSLIVLNVLLSGILLFLAFFGGLGSVDDLIVGRFTGRLTHAAGGLLLIGLVFYINWTFYTIVFQRSDSTVTSQMLAAITHRESESPFPDYRYRFIVALAYLIIGFGMLVAGSDAAIKGAIMIAKIFDLNDMHVGVFVFGTMTSLPTLFMAILFAVSRKNELTVGVILGNNIFKLFGVLGLTVLLTPAGLDIPPHAMQCDLPILMIASLFVLFFGFTGQKFSRLEGLSLIVFYAFYLLLLSLSAIAG